ncbi:MAG: cell division protein ZapA [Ruminococcaceae bacterium]|nr:cell division protein ZapA [Oscillospiraceae bacterium]
MKEKYTISIADVQLNVIADGNQEQIERIVGIIDRRMREILLKSHQCPKTQAALLVALDLCADKIEAKNEIDSLKEEMAELSEQLKRAQDNYDRAQALNLKLEADKAELEAESARLRAIIDEARKNNSVPAEDAVKVEQLTIDDIEEKTEAEPEEPKKENSRSRVGSMFDLLTFSDI